MRREIAALDYRDLSRLLERVAGAFSHGRPGFQFFALEQREIGERLMASIKAETDIAIFRYSEFRDLISSDEVPESLQNLQKQTKQLLDGIKKSEVRQRAMEVQHALIDLLDFVDPERQWVRADRRNKVAPVTVEENAIEPTEE